MAPSAFLETDPEQLPRSSSARACLTNASGLISVDAAAWILSGRIGTTGPKIRSYLLQRDHASPGFIRREQLANFHGETVDAFGNDK